MTTTVKMDPNTYPANCMVGTFWHPNEDERNLAAKHLDKVMQEVDKPLRPYLVRLFFSPLIVPIYSCWGHFKEPNQINNDGYILFRSFLDPTDLLQKIIVPLQKSTAKELGYFTPEFETSTWHTVGLDKMGYIIRWHQVLEEDKKEFLLEKFCELCGV